MRATVNGVEVDGTPDELSIFIKNMGKKKNTSSKEEFRNNFKQWTAQEDKYLIEHYPKDGNTHQKKGGISHLVGYLGRTRKSVMARYGNLRKVTK